MKGGSGLSGLGGRGSVGGDLLSAICYWLFSGLLDRFEAAGDDGLGGGGGG
jgi:hypothetical protein